MKNSKSKIWVIVLLVIIIVMAVIVMLLLKNTLKLNSSDLLEKKDDINNTVINNEYGCSKVNEYLYSEETIYKVVVTNKDGAKIYNSWQQNTQNVVDTVEYGKEIDIVGDTVDYFSYDKGSYDSIDEIKDYYYLVINTCGDSKYVKYSDVSIIESSIVIPEQSDNMQKFYVHSDEYLFGGPGLSFEKVNSDEKIPKGTILDVNTYSRIGNAIWLYVNYNGHSGWILKKYFNSVNYPYNNIKYGSAVLLEEKTGDITIGEDYNLYKYAFGSEVILTIPQNIKVSYNYIISESEVSYYYVNYNGNFGWIAVSD